MYPTTHTWSEVPGCGLITCMPKKAKQRPGTSASFCQTLSWTNRSVLYKQPVVVLGLSGSAGQTFCEALSGVGEGGGGNLGINQASSQAQREVAHLPAV